MPKKLTIEALADLARAALAKCARPDCREAFIQRKANHIYCSNGCRAVMWKRANVRAA